MEKLLKLDLGCGKDKKDDCIGIDIRKQPCVDLVIDLEKGIPLDDNSVDYIYTAHFLEHVNNYDFIMSEIYRVCKNKAIIEIYVPHFSGISGYQEDHKRFFRYDCFKCFDKEISEVMTYNINFKLLKKELHLFRRWYLPLNPLMEWILKLNKRFNSFYEMTILRYLFPCFEIYTKLEVVKDLRSADKE